MPEIIREASRAGALHDAIEVVTNKGQQPWQFVGWTTNLHHFWKGQVCWRTIFAHSMRFTLFLSADYLLF